MMTPENIPSWPDEEWVVPRANLCMRIPRWAHKRMKAKARDEGKTAADLYGKVLEDFLDAEIDRWRNGLFTGPTSSPSTTLSVPKPLVKRVRAIADDRDILISDIVFTAVLLHLGEAPPRAAAA